jgi:hypothetical protein
MRGTPTKRQVSIRQVAKRPVSKRLKGQVFKTSGSKKNIQIYSVLVVLLQPCLQAK